MSIRLWRGFVVALMAVVVALSAARAAAPDLSLDVELDPDTRRFKAVASLVPASRDFRFELHESLTPTAAAADGKALPIRPDGGVGARRGWRVVLPASAASLRLEYGGTLPQLDTKLDHRDVLQGMPPMASPAGSFLAAGSAWYPAPAALFSYRLSVSVPADQRALVAGRLSAESTTDRYRASFEFAEPADGIDLMGGPWVIREKLMPRAGGEAIRLRTYFFRDLDAIAGLADGYLDDTRRYLELYAGQIGAYPFSEFSVVASPLPTGFGMPTLTYIGADVLKLPFIRATSLGHEVLHNWWGNGVYVDYAKGNWSEGLTTFMADYAYKERESAAAAREMRLGWLRDFAAVPEDDQQSLALFRSRTHGAAAAVGYGKAAMLFVMLRDTIGAEAFENGIRLFWQQKRFQPASWDDLRTAFETSSGRPLGTFFAQWLDRAGGPAVTIAAAEHSRQQLTLKLTQSLPAYALRLPVEIVYADRVETRWIDIEAQQDTVTLAVGGRPDGVRLDPDLHLWRRLAAEQLPPILRQWIVARAPRLLPATATADGREAAVALARRLFETAPQTITPADLPRQTGPVLLAGLHADVDATLAAAGLPPRPASLAGRGSAQVWTIVDSSGPPVAVVSATDAEALRALLRPLPHYGGQSWLLFDGGRVVERGVWPAPGRLIPVRNGG